MSRRLQQAICFAVIAAGTILISRETAAATTGLHIPGGTVTWLAAGDSFSSGQGLPNATGRCATPGPASGSKDWASVAYEVLTKDRFPVSAPDQVACTGYKSSEFFDGTQANPAEWNSAMGRFDLVTFTFGGDDVGFRSVLEQCLMAIGNPAVPSNPGHSCQSRESLDSLIQDKITNQWVSFLKRVAVNAVVQGGHIVELGFPDLIELPKFWPVWAQDLSMCWGIGTGDTTELRGLAGDLNSALGRAILAFDALPSNERNSVKATFVDVNTGQPAGPTHISMDDPHLFEPSVGPRHNLCAGQEWINGATITYSGKWYDHSFHPNQAGNNNMGDLLAEVLPHLDWSQLRPVPKPVLGQTNSLLGGFGEVMPQGVNLGGNRSSGVSNIYWMSWGGTNAIGTGFSVPDNTSVKVTIIAFDLGICGGVPTYQRFEWYNPSAGQTFDASNGIGICYPSSYVATCPTSSELFAAWKVNPGIWTTAQPGQLTGFSTPQCWENWVVAGAIGDLNGISVFSITNQLHAVSLSELTAFSNQVCTSPFAPAEWTNPADGPAICPGN